MSRVKETRLPMSAVFGGSACLGLVACASFAAFGLDLGLNLSLVGLLMGLVLPLGIEIRNRIGRPRKLLVLDYRAHQYGHAVARGFMRAMAADRRRWATEYRSSGSSNQESGVQWQIRELQTAVIEDTDGVLLVPAGDDDRLWYTLAAAIKSGLFVTVVDTKPPNRVFREVGIDAPRFVCSDYVRTGTLVAEALVQWMSARPDRTSVLWTGPTDSWAGQERSRQIVYALARAGLLDRMVLCPLQRWSPSSAQCRKTLDLVAEARGDVAVYCADDENATALHLLTLTERAAIRPRMHIIGCNATPDDWGNVPAVALRAVDITVDILAEEQGAQAALLFVRERTGKLSPSERSVYIQPKLLDSSARDGRWLDSLFDEPSTAESPPAPSPGSTNAEHPEPDQRVPEQQSRDRERA